MDGSAATKLPSDEKLKQQKEQLTTLLREVAGEEIEGIIDKRYEQLREEVDAKTGSVYEQLLSALDNQRNANRDPDSSDQRGVNFGRYIRSLAAVKGDPQKAAEWAKKTFGDKYGGDEDPVVKALAATDFDAGGALVADAFSTDIIELLRPKVVVRALGANEVPLDGGSLTVPKHTAGVSGNYIGENQPIVKEEITVGDIKLTPKKLATLVPISNDLLRRSAVGVDTLVRNDTINGLRATEDLYFMRGTGTQYSPKGLLNWAAAANKFDAQATPDLTKVTQDLASAILKLEEANVGLFTPGWIMAPRTKWYLFTLRDGNGNLVFKDEMAASMLFGYPFGTTTQVPTNLGSGSDESEVYFVDFADVVIGQAMNMVVDASGEAAYEESGSVRASFSRDQTVIRVIEEHDLGVRHDASISVIQAVAWALP